VNCHIDIDDTSQRRPDIDRAALQRLVDRAVADDGLEDCQLTVLIVDDATMRDLHEQHFGAARSTDVVSFDDGSHDPASGRLLLGDVAICADVAWQVAERREQQAEARSRRCADECLLYIVHGLLHLLGYDDRNDADRQEMWHHQRELLLGEGVEIGSEPD